MIFGYLSCLLNRHKPSRRSVVWDSFRYTSHCVRCGKPVYRKQGGGWREADAKALEHKGSPEARQP